MILRRIGNKKAIAAKIEAQFPPHKIYIEPFFGAGGMYFNKKKAAKNIVNDKDNDVFNLYHVAVNRGAELKEAFARMPIHSGLLKYWQGHVESDPIQKAVRFLLMSNFTYLGMGGGVRFTATLDELQCNFSTLLDKTADKLFGATFGNTDFDVFLKSISFSQDGRNDEAKTLIYADPPYLGTSDNYANSFDESDSVRLFDALKATNCRFAMSEFDHPFILKQAAERGLNVIHIGERKNLKNRRTEILVTNYEKPQNGLFDIF